MKKSFFVLLLLLLCLSKSFGQDATDATPGPVRLIRSGFSFYRQGAHPEGGQFWDRSFNVLMPTYTQLGQRLYLSVGMPSVNLSSNDNWKFLTFGIEPAVGVLMLKPGKRVRPYVAGVLQCEGQRRKYHGPNVDGEIFDGVEWYQRYALELRLGAFTQLTNRLWLDLTIDAPTGHSLLYLNKSGNSKASFEVFNNSYDTYLPKVQLGVSYQIR